MTVIIYFSLPPPARVIMGACRCGGPKLAYWRGSRVVDEGRGLQEASAECLISVTMHVSYDVFGVDLAPIARQSIWTTSGARGIHDTFIAKRAELNNVARMS